MPYELRKFFRPEELAKQAAADWLTQLLERSTKVDRVPYTVALSGGRITKTFFEEIVRQIPKNTSGVRRLFAGGVHFFWADERCVPPDDAESNYLLARQLLFEPLEVPESHIHRLRGEGPELQALKEALDTICRVAPMFNGQPVLDMIFLGMGEDGHTASLFPGEPDDVMNDPAVYRAVTAAKPPPRRITLGYAAIAAAREVWVLISGDGKEDALRKTLSSAPPTPLGRVIRLRENTTIYTDVKTGVKN